MKVLVNAFGVSSAGGITVLKKTIYEFLENQENQYYIFVFSNQNILNLVQELNKIDNIHSKLIILMLLMLGMYFAHRTAIPYIFLGVVLAVLKNQLRSSGNNSQQ